MPDTIPKREVVTTHTFDLTTTPPQIVWGKREVLVSERKNNLKFLIKQSFDKIVKTEVEKETDEFLDTHYDAAAVEVARQAYISRLAEINAMTTHDELDTFEASVGL